MKNNNFKGFTLVEVIVSLTVFLLVISGVFLLFQQAKKDELQMEQKTEALQNARMALDMLVRELRMAGYNYEEGDPFWKGTKHKIGFTSDIDSNHDGAEDVYYYVDKNLPDEETMNPDDYILRKRIEYRDGTTPSLETVAYGFELDGLDFKYYNADANEIISHTDSLSLEQLKQVQSVEVVINTVSSKKVKGDYINVSLSSSTYPRNINFGVANDDCKPAKPTGFSVSGGFCDASLSWTRPTRNDCPGDTSPLEDYAGVRVYWSAPDGSLADQFFDQKQGDSAILQLEAGSPYKFSIVALDLSGNESTVVNYSSNITIKPYTLPSPGNFNAYADFNMNKIILTWDDSGFSDKDKLFLANYEIEVKGDATAKITTSGMSYEMDLDIACKNYDFQVSAVSWCGNTKTPSPWKNVNTNNEAPEAPNYITGNYDYQNATINLEWGKPTSKLDFCDGYEIDINLQGNLIDRITINSIDITSYQYYLSSLVCDTYDIRMRSLAKCSLASNSEDVSIEIITAEESGDLIPPDIAVSGDEYTADFQLNISGGTSISSSTNYIIRFDSEYKTSFEDYTGRIVYNGVLVQSPLTLNASSLGGRLDFQPESSCERVYFAIKMEENCYVSSNWNQSLHNDFAYWNDCCSQAGCEIVYNNFWKNEFIDGNLRLGACQDPTFPDKNRRINKVFMRTNGIINVNWDAPMLANNIQVSRDGNGNPLQFYGTVLYKTSLTASNVNWHDSPGSSLDPNLSIPDFNSLDDFYYYYDGVASQSARVLYDDGNGTGNYTYSDFNSLMADIVKKGWETTDPVIVYVKDDILCNIDKNSLPSTPFRITIVAAKITVDIASNSGLKMNNDNQALAFVSYGDFLVDFNHNSNSQIHSIFYSKSGFSVRGNDTNYDGAFVTPNYIDALLEPGTHIQPPGLWRNDLIGLPDGSIVGFTLNNVIFDGNSVLPAPVTLPVVFDVTETCVNASNTPRLQLFFSMLLEDVFDDAFGNDATLILEFYNDDEFVGSTEIDID